MTPTLISPRLSFGLPVQVKALNAAETLLEVTGDAAMVGDWWSSYVHRYAIAGYGTKLTSDVTDKAGRKITTSREASCD